MFFISHGRLSRRRRKTLVVNKCIQKKGFKCRLSVPGSGKVDFFFLFHYHNYVQLSSLEALKKSLLVNCVHLACRKLPEK